MTISPEQFAHSNSSYWNEIVPRLDMFMRKMRLATARFSSPYCMRSAPDRHGLVAELGFGQFAAELLGGPQPAWASIHTDIVAEVVTRISGFADTPTRVDPPDATELADAWILRRRLLYFVRSEFGAQGLTPRPRFAGCGFLRAAEGDFAATRLDYEAATAATMAALMSPSPRTIGAVNGDFHGVALYEVKSVSRPFGSPDVRQLIVYSALMQASGSPPRWVGLVNPRRGTFVEWRLNELCLDIAGRPVDDLLQQIITDVSVGASV